MNHKKEGDCDHNNSRIQTQVEAALTLPFFSKVGAEELPPYITMQHYI